MYCNLVKNKTCPFNWPISLQQWMVTLQWLQWLEDTDWKTLPLELLFWA